MLNAGFLNELYVIRWCNRVAYFDNILAKSLCLRYKALSGKIVTFIHYLSVSNNIITISINIEVTKLLEYQASCPCILTKGLS